MPNPFIEKVCSPTGVVRYAYLKRGFVRKIFPVFLLATLMSAMSSFAQVATNQKSFTNAEMRYFRSVLLLIGNPGEPVEVSLRREQVFVSRFGFNEAESKLFHETGQEFKEALGMINAEFASVVSSSSGNLSSKDQANLDNLIEKRDQLVSTLISTLLGNMRPAVSSAFRDPLDWNSLYPIVFTINNSEDSPHKEMKGSV